MKAIRPRYGGPLAATFLLAVLMQLDSGARELSIPERSFVSTARSGPVLQVSASTTSRIAMTFRLPGVELRRVRVGGAEYDGVYVHSAGSLSSPGEPLLPVIRKYVAIPVADNVTLNVTVTKEQSCSGLRVVPRARHSDRGYKEPARETASVYGQDREYPGLVARIERVDRMRGQALAVIDIFPVQYNPARSELRVIEEMELALSIENPTSPVINNVGPMQNLLSGVAVNYDQSDLVVDHFAPGGPDRVVSYGDVCWANGVNWQAAARSVSYCRADYLIIMDDTLDSLLVQTLADRRARYNGFNVAVVRMSQIDSEPDTLSTPETIHDFVQMVYAGSSAEHMSDGKLGYVLLVGDAYDAGGSVMIPSYYGYSADPWRDDKCVDAYYSFIDGEPGDLLADVFLGRIPVNTTLTPNPNQQLENVVNKIMEYCRHPGDTFRNFMVSGDQFEIHDAEIGSYYESIQDEWIPAWVETDTLHRDYHPEMGDFEFGRCIADSINNNDYSIVSIYGHGNPMYPGHTFYPRDYDALSNSTLPVFLLDGCAIGQFDLRPGQGFNCLHVEPEIDPCDAMAEALLVQRRGAIATLAYTRDADVEDADGVIEGLYRAVFAEQAGTLGEVLLLSRLHATTDLNLKIMTLFGDPALNIMWEEGVSTEVDLVVRNSGISVKERGSNERRYGPGDHISIGPVEITAQIENAGRATAANVKVRLWNGVPGDSGATVVDSATVSAIDGFGGSELVVLQYGTVVAGEYVAFVEIDSAGQAEPTARNNTASVSFNVLDLPVAYELGYAFPNPFNPVTVIPFSVPPPGGEVRLAVFNVRGQLVANILRRQETAGYHEVVWDGLDGNGVPVATGSYFVKMVAPGFTSSRKLILLK